MTYLLLTAFILICFRNWFFPGFIAAGDLWPAAVETIRHFSLVPVSWSDAYGGGLGSSMVPYLWNYFQYATPLYILGRILHLPWEYIVRFGYLFPFLIITVCSSYAFAKHFVRSSFALIGVLIYTVNTYSILIISGGQTGVAMAYGLAPFVLLQFVKTIDTLKNITVKQSIKNGLWLALLIGFDLRLTYLILVAIFMFYLLDLIRKFKMRSIFRQVAFIFVIPSLVAASLHLFWILPAVMYGKVISGLGEAYTNVGMLKFLSVADFSHSLSFLHPNWPENLFGKVYFLQPEFLALPFIAFCSLLYMNAKNNKKHIVFFGLLVLIGAFFAKGVQDPFGNIFNWFFLHVPGFVMFRDPTKFYLFIALGYTILIPFFLDRLTILFKKNTWVLSLLFMLFWGMTVRELFVGSVHGTLDKVTVPNDYLKFEKQMSGEIGFSRTFWVPTVEKFAFPTTNHPSIDAFTVTKESSVSGVVKWLENPSAEEQLARWGTQYVVVPIDNVGEIFTTERKYDDEKRVNVMNQLDKLPWLERKNQYTALGVWKTKMHNNLFWVSDGSGIPFTSKNSTSYMLSNITIKMGDTITMSENFNPLWAARFGTVEVSARQTVDGLNEFVGPNDYSGEITIRYVPQQLLTIGLLISGIFSLLYIVLLLII